MKSKRRAFLQSTGQVLSGAGAAGSGLAAPESVKQPAVTGYPSQEGLTLERVSYRARNTRTTIVANLLEPAGFHAEHLAERGFITLAVEASYQRESGGEPRRMEVRAQRLDDISCGIDFLTQDPNSPNRYALSSLPWQMDYFPFDQCEAISPRRRLVIAGSKADTLFWSQDVMKKAKNIQVVEGATHSDRYDRPQSVSSAVGKRVDLFDQM